MLRSSQHFVIEITHYHLNQMNKNNVLQLNDKVSYTYIHVTSVHYIGIRVGNTSAQMSMYFSTLWLTQNNSFSLIKRALRKNIQRSNMKINLVYYYFKTKQMFFLLQMDFLHVLLNLKIPFQTLFIHTNLLLLNLS